MAKGTDLRALRGRLGNVTGRELMRAAEERGWELARIQGSHHIYQKVGRRHRVSIPLKPTIGVVRQVIDTLMEDDANG